LLQSRYMGLATITTPTIIPQADHGIRREQISAAALKVLDSLHQGGFKAFLVGGGVRDLLLDLHPKDFDVATDALPDEVKELFGRSCRLIGRRFRLAHVRMGREIVEVATFRGATLEAEEGVDKSPGDNDGKGKGDDKNAGVMVNGSGRIVRDNVYGNLEQDAWRRDFTVNALYYNIDDNSLVDYTGGLVDLQQRKLRIIGDPMIRYREDPVRMLRALRFAAKLDFSLDRDCEVAIDKCADLLHDIPPARLYDETLKLFMTGYGLKSYEQMQQYRLFEYICPETAACIDDLEDESGMVARFVRQALANTDARIKSGKAVTPAFLFAALLWEPVRRDSKAIEAQGLGAVQAIDSAGLDVLTRQVEQVALPRRYSLVAREIWALQPRLLQPQGRKAEEIMVRLRFRAAYDFLLLRAESGEQVAGIAGWWTKFIDAGDDERVQLLEQHSRPATANPKKRRKRRRRSRPRQRTQAQPV